MEGSCKSEQLFPCLAVAKLLNVVECALWLTEDSGLWLADHGALLA